MQVYFDSKNQREELKRKMRLSVFVVGELRKPSRRTGIISLLTSWVFLLCGIVKSLESKHGRLV